MDGMIMAGSVMVHCDNHHWPTWFDAGRVNEFWDQGQASWLPPGVDNAPGQVRFYWRDNSWSEHHYNMEYLYNVPGSPNWTLFGTESWSADTGQHASSANRIMAKKVTPTPGAGLWYVACATAVFYGYDSNGSTPGDDQLGARTCSPIVYVAP